MKIIAALFVLLLNALPAFAQESLYHFDDAFVRATPMQISAGYVIITNPTDHEDTLLSASAKDVGKIELHHVTTDKNGVMEMSAVKQMLLPAGGKLALRPNGLHLMLYQLERPLEAGKTLVINLHFANAGKVPVVFAIHPITYKGKEEKTGF